MMTTSEKIIENRVRNMAKRRGYTLCKSRRRDPKAEGFGLYQLLDADEFRACMGDLKAIEAYLENWDKQVLDEYIADQIRGHEAVRR